MGTSGDAPALMAATMVERGREAEFEDFVRNVIVTAGQRAQRSGQWRLLKPAGEQPDDATRAYMFVFYGDVPLEDWDLDKLFTEAYGEEEGARHLQRFSDLVEGEQTIYAFGGEVSASS